MVERKITLSQIRVTLEEPDEIYNIGNDRRSIKLFGTQRVVVAWHVRSKIAIVRTVFWQE